MVLNVLKKLKTNVKELIKNEVSTEVQCVAQNG